jgi:hypothetical protein
VSAAVFQRINLSLRSSEERDGLVPNFTLNRLFPDVRGFGNHVPTIGIDAGAPDVAICIGNLNHLFSARSYIAEPASRQAHVRLVKIPVLLRLAWAV